MKKFSDVGYIQLLLHPTERKIAIRPCREKDTHSIRWRLDPEKPFYSKSLSFPHFGSALYCIMGWNPDYLYKIRGIWAKRFSEQIIVFNLSNGVPAVIVTNDGNITGAKRRVEMCPDEWTDDFGDEFYEHVNPLPTIMKCSSFLSLLTLSFSLEAGKEIRTCQRSGENTLASRLLSMKTLIKSTLRMATSPQIKYKETRLWRIIVEYRKSVWMATKW